VTRTLSAVVGPYGLDAVCARCGRRRSDEDVVTLVLTERPDDDQRRCRVVVRCPACGLEVWRWLDRPEDAWRPVP
jgi:hypothetical protein